MLTAPAGHLTRGKKSTDGDFFESLSRNRMEKSPLVDFLRREWGPEPECVRKAATHVTRVAMAGSAASY